MTLVSARPPASTSVVIGIATRCRPDDLHRLLSALPAVIRTAVDGGVCATVEVIVVDNDPAGSAAEVVGRSRLPVRYLPEQTPGVTAVRNRVLDETDRHDVIVFIDDDETPADAGWLAALLHTHHAQRAHVVAGPVRTVVMDGDLDPWVQAGGFFARAHRDHLATGDAITAAASNNLLLDAAFVRRAGVRFDTRFGRSGGEDSLFTSQLRERGARMVWCREALVLDHLPAARQTRAHALRRTRGMAAAGVRVGLALAGLSLRARMAVQARALAAAAAHLCAGGAEMLAGRLTGSTRRDARGRRRLARALGTLDGVRDRELAIYGTPVRPQVPTQEEMT